MKIIKLAVVLTILGTGCGYSHVGPSMSTFSRPTPPPDSGSLVTQTGPLSLRIHRSLDTILRGPDSEEEQTLMLDVHDYRLNQRLQIPSANVTVDFTVTRFSPGSKGEDYKGYLIVKKVTPTKVEAYLHLDVTAVNTSGSYTETAKFHGNFTFVHKDEDTPEP